MELIKRKQYYPKGMTVRELKDYIQSWPDNNIYGRPNEVWVETGLYLSSAVKRVCPLNLRRDENGNEWGDIHFASSAFDDESTEGDD